MGINSKSLDSINIGLCSLNQFWEDKEKNKEKVRKFCEIAKKKDANLIIFPEMTLTGFSVESKNIIENFDASESIKFFKNLAKDLEIGIIFGIALENDGKNFNSCIFLDDKGEIKSIYKKIHLFTFAKENLIYNNGELLQSCLYRGINFGLTICYDLRFPEIYSLLAKNNEVVINIANWPKRRITHWNTLLQARAIENQIYMVGVNRTGIDQKGNNYVKSSYIFDPFGIKLNPYYKSKELDVYMLNKDYVKESREKFPTFKDKNYKLYKNLYNGVCCE